MNNPLNKLISILRDRHIVIWGARMTGIGFLWFAKYHNCNVIAFIDSDQSLTSTTSLGIPIYSPEHIYSLNTLNKDLIVVVAASTNEDEIISELIKYKVSWINYKDYCKNFFTIDISGICNLKCPSCANSLNHNKKRGFMLVSDFKKITEKILSETIASHFVLYNWGEPLLHPNLSEIIDYLHSKGISTAISTNLSIKSDISLQKLVKSSPDYLKISVSGYYPDTYNRTHTGGDINLVKSNLYKLRYYMNKSPTSFFVEVNYHLYKQNIGNDLEKMKSLCKELGFIFSTTYATLTPVETIISYLENKTTVDINKLLLIDIDKRLEITYPFKSFPCRNLTNQININWDRSVALCCASNPIIHPDFLEISLSEIENIKNNHPLCISCIKHGVHQFYNQINHDEMKKIAGI